MQVCILWCSCWQAAAGRLACSCPVSALPPPPGLILHLVQGKGCRPRHVTYIKCFASHVDFLQIWDTWNDKWKCKWGPWVGVRVHPIQSLGVSILHSIILKRKHSGHACYHSHFPHHRGPELLISTLHWDLGKIVQCINIAHAGKLFHRPVLWLQTCTSDQHLIKHTQVCFKSNLEQISQDSQILWTWPRSIHTHTCAQYE